MVKNRILIVDDERIIREGISRSINWEQMGLELQGTCEDAFDALDIFITDPPDIAIIDISMPGMTGLELIETVRNKGLAIQFIILSGYGEFEFAQKAISFGVKQYLLKPLDIKKLKNALTEIVEEIRTTTYNNTLKLDFLIKKVLKNDREIDTEFLKALLKDINGKFWMLASLTYIDSSSISNNFISFIHGFEFEGIFIQLLEVEEHIEPEDLYSFLYNIKNKNKIAGNQVPVISSGTPGFIESIYSQFVACGNKILKFQLSSLLSIDNNASLSDLVILIDKMKSSITNGESDVLGNVLEKLFLVVSDSKLTLEKTKILLIQILDIINTGNNKIKKVDSISRNIQLMKTPDFRSLFINFDSVIQSMVCNNLENTSKKHLPWLVEKTKQELKNNYADNNITLRTFCENIVFSNPDYLGKLFHKYVKQSFHEYLNMIRINAAKEIIIQNPYLAMYDVAKKTGFGDNSQYFSKVFKNIERVTPSQFKNSIKKGLLI